mmetsp:Transcript_28483/g.80212  ORF Transcript_28483/g.80212 Transcript_28483/m.80212 type:complete len:131 (+) Transcript_28483:373-765(+)
MLKLARIHQSSSSGSLDETTSKALVKREDADLRLVIAQIDREKHKQGRLERAKRKSACKEKAEVIANGEPIYVNIDITDPLGIAIDLTSIHVALGKTSFLSRQYRLEAIPGQFPTVGVDGRGVESPFIFD